MARFGFVHDISSLTKVWFLMHPAPSLSEVARNGHLSCYRPFQGLPSPVDTPAHSNMFQALYRFPVSCSWIATWHECLFLIFLCCFLVLFSQAFTLAKHCQHNMSSREFHEEYNFRELSHEYEELLVCGYDMRTWMVFDLCSVCVQSAVSKLGVQYVYTV